MGDFLLVKYPTNRSVYVDGQQCGLTNAPIPVGEGRHKVDLGPYSNYKPESQLVDVRGFPYEAPKTISFSPR
jgi:hypothetical protein